VTLPIPIPSRKDISLKWIVFFIFGIMLGFQLRDVVVKAAPSHMLVGLDWGILLGVLIYYVQKIL
jgi:hypothetical protein